MTLYLPLAFFINPFQRFLQSLCGFSRVFYFSSPPPEFSFPRISSYTVSTFLLSCACSVCLCYLGYFYFMNSLGNSQWSQFWANLFACPLYQIGSWPFWTFRSGSASVSSIVIYCVKFLWTRRIHYLRRLSFRSDRQSTSRLTSVSDRPTIILSKFRRSDLILIKQHGSICTVTKMLSWCRQFVNFISTRCV